jgi:hypothetical protein
MKATPWRRYGKERTYFVDDDGTTLGWVDGLTGEVHADAERARLAIEAWLVREVATPFEPEKPVGVAVQSPPADIEREDPVAEQPSMTHLNDTETEIAHAADTADESRLVGDAGQGPALVDNPDHELKLEVEHEDEPGLASDWEDLALRHPGQAVREQARTELAADWQESKFRTVLRIAFDTKTDERAWRLGAAGEVTIGAKLEKLAEHGWRVLHSVPIGEHGSDIDHIAIGPGGVWTINAKNHPGKKIWVAPRQIRVDGHTVPYLRNSEYEANRVRKILMAHLGWEPYVRPALVFMTGTLVPEVTIKGRPESVEILDRLDVNRRLKREPVRLSADQVSEVFEIARRSTTWVR